MIIDQNKHYLKYIIKGLFILFLYFTISLYKYIPFNILHINIEDVKANTLITYNIILELTIIFIIYMTYEKEFKKAIKDIKENHLTYFQKYWSAYLIGIIIMILSNIIIGKLGGGISENENAIRNEFQVHPLYTYISAVFLAPILEESIFRLGIKSIFKNKYIYFLASGLIFGGLHLMGMEINKLLPLYLISYCSAGFAFAYMMNKTNNVLVSTGFHFMHNGIIMGIQFFLLIFT